MPWWCHQMEIFSALLAICAVNSPVTGESHAQRPVTRRFNIFFDMRLNKRLSKQSRGWWFETPSRSLWRHRNALLQLTPYGFANHSTSFYQNSSYKSTNLGILDLTVIFLVCWIWRHNQLVILNTLTHIDTGQHMRDHDENPMGKAMADE